MKKLTKSQIDAIVAEYMSITHFDRNTLPNLAKKHDLTVDELLDIIPL